MDSYFGGKKYSKSASAKSARRRMRRKNKETGNDRTLKELREIALINDVSIYRRRKDGNGFTKTMLAKGPLKARLTRMKVNYKSPRIQNIMDLPIFDPTPALMFGEWFSKKKRSPKDMQMAPAQDKKDKSFTYKLRKLKLPTRSKRKDGPEKLDDMLRGMYT